VVLHGHSGSGKCWKYIKRPSVGSASLCG
jgi:hypothetical protein